MREPTFDLQSHSTFSDGALSPAGVVATAKPEAASTSGRSPILPRAAIQSPPISPPIPIAAVMKPNPAAPECSPCWAMTGSDT